jgi:dienelactone hydrolase
MSKEMNRREFMKASAATGIILFMAPSITLAEESKPIYMEDQQAYAPPNGRGPLVILLSGASGLDRYRSYAAEVARLGYYAVLLNGNWYDLPGSSNLKGAIEEAQRSPNALPGKAAVIGFSKGGGGALANAATMQDLVSAIVAYYPETRNVRDMRSFAAQFRVPILVLTGQLDTYYGCCLIESMIAMETAAKEGGKPFKLVIYPKAGHMFNLKTEGSYRAEDAADAWRRTTKMLNQYQPLR